MKILFINQDLLPSLRKCSGHSILHWHSGLITDKMFWKSHTLAIKVPLVALQHFSKYNFHVICKTHMSSSAL